MKRWPLVISFVLFIALCATLAYWAMQFFKPPVRPVAAPPRSAQAPVNIDAAASLFGGKGSAAVASNFQLKGVIMAGTPADSVAIIAADGKPAQAIRANSEVAPGVKVKEIHRGYVVLLDNGVEKRVELPEENQLAMGIDGANAAPVATRPLPPRPAPSMPATVVNNPDDDTGAAPAASGSAAGTGAAANTAAAPAAQTAVPANAGTPAASSTAANAAPQQRAVPQAAQTAPSQAVAPGAGMGSPPITNQGSLAGGMQTPAPAAPAAPAVPGMPVPVQQARP
ncbi:MAG: type II secretion system protein N [Burkholderiaceae bacterium]